MRVIRIMLVALVLIAAAAPVAAAQRNPLAGARGKGWSAQILTDIKLDANRQAKFDSIVAEYRPVMQAIRDGGGPQDDAAARARFQELMQEQMAEARALLTSEQQKVFDRNVARMRARGRGPMAPEQQ